MPRVMMKWDAAFDPDETKSYSRDWTLEMDEISDTIATATFTVETPNTGLGVMDTIIDGPGKIVTVWLSADDKATLETKAGSIILLRHTVTTTTGGRTYNERIGLKIEQK